MKFSLRSTLLLFLLITLGTGWYINWRRATFGIKLPVAQPLKVDHEVPEFITEFSSGAKVRDHDQNYPWPAWKRSLELHDYRWSDITKVFPESRRQKLLDMARKVLDDENSDFKTATIAAKLLDQAGDQDAITRIVSRFKNFLGDDENKGWELFQFFPMDQLIAADPTILDLLQSRKGEDSKFGELSDSILYYNGIETQPFIRRSFRAAELEAQGLNYSTNNIPWLIENAPTVEALDLAERRLFGGYPEIRGRSAYLALALLKADFSESKELQKVSDRIEKRMADSIRRTLSQDDPKADDFARLCLNVLVRHCSDISKMMLLEVLQDPKWSNHHDDVADALIRLGLSEQCEAYVKNAMANIDGPNVHVHKGLSWASLCWWSDPSLPILHRYEQCFGRQEMIEICRDLAEHRGNLVAFRKLAELFADTHNPEIAKLIRDKLFLDGNPENAIEALQMLEKIGVPDLGELWARLPASAAKDRFLMFYQHWHTNQLTQQKLVDWINRTLEPSSPAVVEDPMGVVESPTKTMLSLERFLHAGSQSQHQLATATLARTNCGDLAYGEDMHRDEVPSWMYNLALITSGEFDVTSCSSELNNGLRTFRLVVNQRLYKFSALEPDYSMGSFDTRAVVELLNTIAIRRKIKKRFFAYPTEFGEFSDKGCCLVLFVEPTVVADLKNKFGLAPIEGSEYYMKH